MDLLSPIPFCYNNNNGRNAEQSTKQYTYILCLGIYIFNEVYTYIMRSYLYIGNQAAITIGLLDYNAADRDDDHNDGFFLKIMEL